MNKEDVLIERMIEATKADKIEWKETSSYLAYSAHFEEKYYMIEQFLGETKILVMNEKYDFIELEKFKNTEALKDLYTLIMDKYPEFKQRVIKCLKNQREFEAEEEHYKKKINITPELAESLNGRCFLDLDMSDRIEAFRFIKTSTGIDMHSIGCDNHWGYSHVHHDDFGEYEINDTFNGIWIDMVNEKSFLVREIPQEKFDRANAIVNEIMDEAEKRENEFKKKQKEFGLLGEK